MNAPTRDFDYALKVESRLRPIVRLLDILQTAVRPDDVMCHGCMWEIVFKPLLHDLVGWGRGYPPKDAVEPSEKPLFRTLSDLRAEERTHPRKSATTEAEAWLRSTEAWDIVTGRIVERLYAMDPANGCAVYARTEAAS